MANIAIFRINYKSDFILTLNSDAGWMTPFCIKFWTGAPSQAYFAGYDGTTYTHCAPVEGDPTKLVVQFDDHHLPVGDLTFQIGYHFTVADFPTSVEDEVLNQASVIIEVDDAPAQVMLDLNGETAPEIEFSLPAYANEAQRIANEQARIAAEQQRIANEDARIQAEETRQYNEQQRIQHEEYRVSEFARLKSESEAATSSANTAATLANEKAQLAADKAALAQAAATLANEKAQLAADKAALAQAAATLANEKAALAQQKATYAQTQGDYAKAQGDYAKAQGEIAEEDHERAEADHTRAESDHATAGSDHTQAGTDHQTAVNDHAQATSDHTQAGTDHTRAESDHAQATSDHTQAGADHTRAESDHATASADHNQAGQDHTRAESDHTRAESDHAAVEVYVDSLGAFDISAYHATGGVLAEYADLAAALGTNGANIPDALRKGGMSVKFVQNNDHKYVQYRLMKSTFSAAPANWQGVDNEPTAGSDNLVKSGGIYGALYVQYGSLKNAQTNTISTVIVTKKSNGISFNLRRIEQITFVAVTGTISFYRCHYSSVTNKFVVRELLSSVDNSSAENGSIKTIDVSIDLLENEFIGVSGAVAFMMNMGNDFVSDGFNNSATYTSYTEVVGQNIAVIYSSKKYVTKSEYDTNKESTITQINGIKNAISEEISYGAAQIDGVTPSLSTSNPYVSWITKDPNNTKLSHVSKIKFYAGIGTTVLYKVAINSGVATTTQITSIPLTSEGLREVDVNIDLAENEYIGWGGNISYKNDATLGYKTITLNNGSMTEGNMWVGLEILDYRYIDLNDIKDEISEIKHYEVIVDINGKGEYLNPFDAMVGLLGKDTAEHPITIKVLPGTYNMPGLKYRDYYTYCVDRHLSIVGTDKVNCILRNDNGYYNPSRGQQSLDDVADAAPLKIAGNVYIANLTIISTDAENAESQDAVDHQSYCIHVDSDSAEGNTLEIHNCKLVNNHFACVGFGIRKNNTLKITDSELYADFFDTSSAILSGHNNNGGSSVTPEEHLFVKNCTLVSSNGNAVKVINPTQANGAKFDCVFVNNVVDIPADKGVELANVVSLDKLCYGNNLPSMNYTE